MSLEWSPPLLGVSVLSTRPAGQNDAFLDTCRSFGATTYAIPLIRREAIGLHANVGQALRTRQFDVALFTSAEAVRKLAAELGGLTALQTVSCYAVSATTHHELSRYGLSEIRVPAEPTALGLARQVIKDFTTPQTPGRTRVEAAPVRIFFPGPQERSPEPVALLTEAGFQVNEVALYRTVAMSRTLGLPEHDWVAFFSPSAVHSYGRHRDSRPRIGAACLGPTTAAAARQLGLPPLAVALRPHPQELAAAIVRFTVG